MVVSELDIDVVTRGRWWADDGKYREELRMHDPYKDGLPAEIEQQQTDQYVALFRLFDEYQRHHRTRFVLELRTTDRVG